MANAFISLPVPIIPMLMKWLKDQDPSLEIELSENSNYIHISYNKKWLGVVTLIYPGQDQHQGLQYDWYDNSKTWEIIAHDPNGRYFRKVFAIADPVSFPEILKTAVDIRDDKPVVWHEVYWPSTRGLQPVKGE